MSTSTCSNAFRQCGRLPEVSQQAAQHFKISDMHIVDPPLTPIPTDLPTQLVVDRASDGARITFSFAVHSLLGAWIGVVMFFLLTNVLGLRIPVLRVDRQWRALADARHLRARTSAIVPAQFVPANAG